MTVTAPDRRPESDFDLFSPEVLDPYPMLDALREQSPAVHMSVYDYWLLTRYEDVRAATADWRSYTSAQGVGLTPWFNEQLSGSVLGTDPPEHDKLRAILSAKLKPRALTALRDEISGKAVDLVTALLQRPTFDAVTDLARVFPVNVVADLVGLPQDGRERLCPGADAMFTAFGPETPILAERLPAIQAYIEFMANATNREQLRPGSWGEAAMEAVDAGEITIVAAMSAMGAYLTAGMDTTVNAIGSMLKLFAEQPDVWETLRHEPSLAGCLFEELLRWESPLVGFFRVTTRDTTVGDVTIPVGQRVLLHLAAANRDHRHYPDPHVFDIRRRPVDHLAFGYGVHRCAGQGLARMEVMTLLEALIPRVKKFHLRDAPVRHYNPVVQGWDSVPLMVEREDR
ncbi:MAG: cytochrome P450 [Mycobacterium sp.]